MMGDFMSIQMPMQANPIRESLENGIGPLTQNWYTSCKSAADCVLAGMLFVLTGPFMIVAMILVRLTSKGPAIYSQMRLGYQGEAFRIYKIRSMVHDCEAKTGPQWAKPRDSRVTRVGWLLRYSHIDELPQLWNILRGEMSLIGPRPERPEIAGKLEQELPDYRQRLLVRPGITGLAQVQLPPDTDLESVRRKLLCDIYYVQHVNFLMDIKILLATALRLLGMPVRRVNRMLLIPAIEMVGCVDDKGSNEFMMLPQAQSACSESLAR
jgi:lipopolysaccharide/colanic/teichoic acid biosynthesis glycosyltransferase